MGEQDLEPFRYLFIGSLVDPAFEDRENDFPFKRPFVTEWLVPYEEKTCPAYNEHGLCVIYEHRPYSCRIFPRIHDGQVHPFCHLGERVCGEEAHLRYGRAFLGGLARLDAHILNLLHKQGKEALARFLDAGKDPFRVPFLYSPYLIKVLDIAKVQTKKALLLQRTLLEGYYQRGLKKLTFSLSDTNFVVTGKVKGLLANLDEVISRL